MREMYNTKIEKPKGKHIRTFFFCTGQKPRTTDIRNKKENIFIHQRRKRHMKSRNNRFGNTQVNTKK